MTVFSNTNPPPNVDGVAYALDALLPGAEADLFNTKAGYDPIVLPYEVAFVASVLFSVAPQFFVAEDGVTQYTAEDGVTPYWGSGASPLASETSYVVAQTDLGDGNWIDVAWCVFTSTSGTGLFCLSGGVGGANAFPQSRSVGTSPGSNGSNQFPLGGRLRFVGKGITTGVGQGSSSSSGGMPIPQVSVSIRYRLLGYR